MLTGLSAIMAASSGLFRLIRPLMWTCVLEICFVTGVWIWANLRPSLVRWICDLVVCMLVLVRCRLVWCRLSLLLDVVPVLVRWVACLVLMAVAL